MEKLKKTMALVLVLLTVLSLSGCVDALRLKRGSGKRLQVARFTTTVETSTGTDDVYAMSYGYEFDEKGLASAVEVRAEGENLRMELRYTLDGRGNPESVSTMVMGYAIRVGLENHYEGSRLAEAMITECTMGDETILGPGADGEALWESSSAAGLVGLVLPVLQYYSGYRDCSLSVEGIGTLLRNEDGLQVYSYMPSGISATETLTEYSEDGSVTVTHNIYRIDGGEKELMAGTVTERDGELFLRRTEMVTAAGGCIALGFRIEDAGTNAEGKALRRAVVDSCTISSSPEGESVYAEEYRERFLGKEFELYTLDDEGRVSSASQDQGLLQGETGVDYVAESTTWYNAYGQVTRTEQYTSSDSYTNRTVTETEYRP